jgi:hypothetical protein
MLVRKTEERVPIANLFRELIDLLGYSLGRPPDNNAQ